METKSGKGVGASLLRKEDLRHLRGRGTFVADVALPRTQQVVFLRSPHAHARIIAVAPPPEGRARVFTAADLPIKPMRAVPQISGFRASDYPPLAVGKVRFAGEIVAACIAPTRGEAEDLAAAVSVEYEPLPPVMDAAAAIDTTPSLLHEHWPDNVFIERTMQGGDMDAVARAADIVIKRDYRMHRQSGLPMEGRAALAWRDHRLDELVFYDSTQVPHTIRLGLAEMLGIEERRIRVVAPDVGGGFGTKARLSAEEVAVAALALALDHPVRWVEDHAEHLLSAVHTRDHLYRMTGYADRSGRILGIECDVIVDAGAYALWPNGPFLETGMAARNLPGPYDIRNYRAHTYTVATNKPPIGPYRGVGRPGACFAIERTIDEVARALGRDPFEVRVANMVRPEQMPYTTIANMVFDNGDYPRAARRCAELVDLAAIRARQKRGEPDGRLVGVGFAAYAEQTGHGAGEWVQRGSPFIPGYESCTARMNADGSLILQVGIQSHGQGLETTLAQLAHEVISIDPARVSVRHGDTDISPFGMGTMASRSMVFAGGAVTRASRLLRDKILRIGAHLLQTDPGAVRCEDGSVVGPSGSVRIEEVARIAHLRMEALPDGVDPLLDVTATYEPSLDTGVFSYATQAAVVVVDPQTGAVELLDFAVVEDCGTVVNPMIVDGQIRGGIVQGIGTALYEEIAYDEGGQLQTATLADYHLPGAADLPPIKIAHFITPSPHTEFGVKGMGEGGAIAPPAAIANAVRDALAAIGAEVNETPITPQRVRAAIQAARKDR